MDSIELIRIDSDKCEGGNLNPSVYFDSYYGFQSLYYLTSTNHDYHPLV